MNGMRSGPRRLHRAGIAVLAVGWIAAAAIWFLAGPEDTAATAERSRREVQQIERLGGKMTVQMVELEDWLGSLWHGRRLAATLAVLSGAAGALCIHLARLAAEDAER